jgi:hypothetical protein
LIDNSEPVIMCIFHFFSDSRGYMRSLNNNFENVKKIVIYKYPLWQN